MISIFTALFVAVLCTISFVIGMITMYWAMYEERV